MTKETAKEVALGFVECINRHDVAGLVALMTEDHRFIDSLGHEVRGAKKMQAGWVGYFAWFPDYFIKVEETICGGSLVAMFGTAQGTYAGNPDSDTGRHWEIPAAWMAVVRDGRVAEWRVYADNEPVRKIMTIDR